MESVVTQVKEIPSTLVGSVKKTPVMAIGIAMSVIVIVLVIEAWKPGLITGPIRSGLNKLGVKTA